MSDCVESGIRTNVGWDNAFRRRARGRASARYAAGEWKNMRGNLAEGLTGAHRLRIMPPE